jgi:hypothetical protein
MFHLVDQDDGRIPGGFALQPGDQQSCRPGTESAKRNAVFVVKGNSAATE